MNSSLWSAGHTTHLKIVAVSLIASIACKARPPGPPPAQSRRHPSITPAMNRMVGLYSANDLGAFRYARFDSATAARTETDQIVIKAGKRTIYTDSGRSTIR